MNNLLILNNGLQKIGMLSNQGLNPRSPFYDDLYVQELETGAETFEFTTLNNNKTANKIVVGNYILFKYKDKYKLFQITEVTYNHNDEKKEVITYCEIVGLELLSDYADTFTIEGNIVKFFNTVLNGTRWQLRNYSKSLETNIQKISYDSMEKVYSIIQENLKTFGGIEIEFNIGYENGLITGFYIDVYENGQRGSDTRKRFTFDNYITGLERKVSFDEFCSGVCAEGKNGLTIKGVEWSKSNGDPCDKKAGSPYLISTSANQIYNKGNNYIIGKYSNSDCESNQTLAKEAWDYLHEHKEPKIEYECLVNLLYDQYEDINIGDTNYIIDRYWTPEVYLSCRIFKLSISFTDPSKNTIVFSNFKELTSKIIKPIDSDSVNTIVSAYFPVSGAQISHGAIADGHIDEEYYKTIKTDMVTASVARVGSLIADKADIKDLSVLSAKIGKLETGEIVADMLHANSAEITSLKVNKANITDLNVTNANISNIKADIASINKLVADKANITDLNVINATVSDLTTNKANVSDLNATNATVGTLSANVGKINTLLAGNITSSNIQAGGITSKSLTIEDGFINNAMIGSVDAGKINTGTLDTNRVNVQSEGGNLLIQDNTIQIRDNTRVRVQIGKDGANDYSMNVWDTQGNIMFDARGMTQDAIKSQIIRNDMVSPNANINGSKLNINSVINEVNEEGTTTLKSSKIKFDDINQTLDVAFSSLKSTTDDTKKKTEANTTSISIVQGEIKTAIENTKIVKDGQTVLLKDEYSKLEQNVGSISSKVSSTETKLNNMKIGGRNLILKSNEPTESSSYLIKVYDLTDDLIYGEEYTFVIKGSVVANQKFGIWMNQGSTNVGYATTKFSEGVYYVSFKAGTPNSEINKRTLSLYNYPSSSTASTVEWVALYKGNKPLDWTAAPEDIDQNISDAVKMETEDGEIVYVKDQVSDVTQDLDGITNKVSKIEVEFDDDGTVGQIKSQVSSLQQTADGFTLDFFKKIEDADANTKEILSHINFTADGIVLGQDTYPTKLIISKDKIKFVAEDGSELAYFSDNKLLIQNSEILDTLKIANYGFLPNAGGSLTIGTIK